MGHKATSVNKFAQVLKRGRPPGRTWMRVALLNKAKAELSDPEIGQIIVQPHVLPVPTQNEDDHTPVPIGGRKGTPILRRSPPCCTFEEKSIARPM